jgi:hypothetical protein
MVTQRGGEVDRSGPGQHADDRLRRQTMICGPCRYGPAWPCMGELTSANLDRHRDLLGLITTSGYHALG